MHQAVGLDLRQQTELRIDDGDTGEIEVVAAQLGKDFAEARGRIGLKAGRANVAQYRVIAALVGLIERQQRRPDQDQYTIAVDLRRLWRLSGRLGMNGGEDGNLAESAP